jgi:hypothetical protein
MRSHSKLRSVKSRVCRTIVVLAMTMTVSGLVYVENSWAQGGTAAGVGGPGAGGGSSSGSGSSGGGDGSTGGGGTAPSSAVGGVPDDARLTGDVESGPFFASTSPVPAPFSRPQSSGGLTRAQERTWDAFAQCATSGAMLDQLRIDGSFTFQSNTQSDARAIKDCMTRTGYRFDY